MDRTQVCSRRNDAATCHSEKTFFSCWRILFALFICSDCPAAHAQTATAGKTIVTADFSSPAVDRKAFFTESWNIPDTWELRDGAIACIYDAAKQSGKLHGRSIDCRFLARDIRVSYRVRFESKKASLAMLPNAVFPSKTRIPIWHIASVNAGLARSDDGVDVSILEHDFTYDPEDPGIPNPQAKQSGFMKELGAFGIPGAAERGKAGLRIDTWHAIVLESVGSHWTMWVDGREVLSLEMKHANCDKDSINFVGFGPLLLDDLLVEDLSATK